MNSPHFTIQPVGVVQGLVLDQYRVEPADGALLASTTLARRKGLTKTS